MVAVNEVKGSEKWLALDGARRDRKGSAQELAQLLGVLGQLLGVLDVGGAYYSPLWVGPTPSAN